MRVAVITVAAGRHAHFLRQRKAILAGQRQPDEHILVAMDDPGLARTAADSGCAVIEFPVTASRLPLAAARNAGARRALDAGAELLVFLDVDCIPGPGLVRRYHECATSTASCLLCGSVTYLPPAGPDGYPLDGLADLAQPHPARPRPADNELRAGGDLKLFWSLSFAVDATGWHRIGGFCERYEGYGAEDTDFGQLAGQAGISLSWVGGAPAYHQYHPTADPPVHHLDDILRNGRIFHDRWGWWPMTGWLQKFEAAGLVHHDSEADDWQRK